MGTTIRGEGDIFAPHLRDQHFLTSLGTGGGAIYFTHLAELLAEYWCKFIGPHEMG